MREIGWDPYGIDFSSTPPNMFNVPVHIGTVHDSPYALGSFDLVTLWAVLEHTHDPLDMLKQVRSFLKPDGRALVLVPNFNSIPGRFMRHDDVPRHLVMFTPKTLRLMAARAGLEVKRIVFGDEIFSGSTRGMFNYLWKLLNGEQLSEIVAQNRASDRWAEFSTCIHGLPSDFMLKVDRFDIKITRYLDKIVNRLGYGFTMTVELGLPQS
jgi:SAM-dependent methyltransferase